jgi:hypothetical protein
LRNAQGLGSAFGQWVVKTNALDEATIAAIAFVSHNNVEKRASFGAAACESNDDHDESLGG